VRNSISRYEKSVLRPWNFKIAVRRDSTTPVYLQIANALIDEIRRGRLSTRGTFVSSRLPVVDPPAKGESARRKFLAYGDPRRIALVLPILTP
jgi:hypothetical protein